MPRYSVNVDHIGGNTFDFGKGVHARLPSIEPGLGRHAQDWNVSLKNPSGENILLWIWEVEVAFSLGGVTGQSHHRRQFFPRNLTQPTLLLKGTAPNNFQYNRLASFVRTSQEQALGAASFKTGRAFTDGSVVPTTQLHLRSGKAFGRKDGRTTRGTHKAWVCEGYIKTVAGGATRFEFAKDYEIEFILVSSEQSGGTGIFEDTSVRGSRLLPWLDIFEKGAKAEALKTDNIIETVALTAGDIASGVATIFD